MNERLQKLNVPYAPFPKHPEKTNIVDFEVYKYIEADQMDKYIKDLSDRNSLRNYDQVLVNWRGGWDLFIGLKNIQGYKKWPYICEFHRTDAGISITKPVDSSLKNRKVLVVDDVFDRGLTINSIFDFVGQESRAVVAVWKDGVAGQIDNPRVDAAVITDNKWLGGVGMNMGLKGEKEILRRYSGIVVKP